MAKMTLTQKKTLADLGLPVKEGENVSVTGLASDNREVRDGYLFAALPGTRIHGGEFIRHALKMGASAVLTDARGLKNGRKHLERHNAVAVLAEDPRQTLAFCSALWFGRQPETAVAVTGTNGKTSVANFTRQIWAETGCSSINLGTAGVEGCWNAPLSHTTPDPITLHRVLAEATAAGVTHAAMEASSHGLQQRRMDGVRLNAAAFTNLTRDHLDYHESFDDYFSAKARLFSSVMPQDGVAVINMDDDHAGEMAAIAQRRGQDVISVGTKDYADLKILKRSYTASGQTLRFLWQGGAFQRDLNLIGGFQAENVLVAAGLAIATGSEPERVFDAFCRISTVSGRMQLAAKRGNGAVVFVDYAHTPAAISTAIKALRPHVLGRLIAIIGAGGDRDPSKRPLMGESATLNADMVIVTDDNPRYENPRKIRAAVMAGCKDALEIGDRAEAILRGVDALGPGDALLVCGKGHETCQIIGDDVFPFNDCEQASVAVAILDGSGT